jgi:hypothetical protein
VALVLVRALADCSETVEELPTAKRILLLTFVVADMPATAHFSHFCELRCAVHERSSGVLPT